MAKHITTSDVHNVYEQYAIEMTQADASALQDHVNGLTTSREAALNELHAQAQMARASWEDDN